MIQYSAVRKLLDVLGLSKRLQLYGYAKSQIGICKSGIRAPIDVGCVEAVNTVFEECFGSPIDQNLATIRMHQTLIADPRFRQTEVPLPGDIIISPAINPKKAIKHGHVGIVSSNEKIMSNNSANGAWDEHLDFVKWEKRYVQDAGFQILYFRVIL